MEPLYPSRSGDAIASPPQQGYLAAKCGEHSVVANSDAMTLDGVLYYADNLWLTRALRSMANEVYRDINQ
jgi:hypothetical protein